MGLILALNGPDSSRFATPLLLQFLEGVDCTTIQWTLMRTGNRWMDSKDVLHEVRATHNLSVVGSIPTGTTIWPRPH
jgi:hypothetical protein